MADPLDQPQYRDSVWERQVKHCRRIDRQALDDRNTYRTKTRIVSEAEANMKRPLTYYGTERPQNYLRRIRYCMLIRLAHTHTIS